MGRVSVWLDRLGWAIGISLFGLSVVSVAITLYSRQPQVLPLGARLVVSGQTINLEVATTSEQQTKGLSYRHSLPPDKGMLFPVNPPRPVTVWMKNMFMPLDVVSLYQGRVVTVAPSLPPCQTNTCPLYKSEVVVDRVVELPAGTIKKLKLKQGVQVRILPVIAPAICSQASVFDKSRCWVSFINSIATALGDRTLVAQREGIANTPANLWQAEKLSDER